MNRLLPLSITLCALLVGVPRPAGSDVLSWVASRRAAHGLAALRHDRLLSETAAAYAKELAAAGRISHRGADGSDALTRYLRRGGTSARVGEIIGAGGRLAEVERAWLASPTHRDIILARQWTHVGWGEARAGRSHVWVVLFLQRRVAGLTVETDGAGVRVQGRFLPPEAVTPVLLAGLERVAPELWDPAGRRFSFFLEAGQASGYVRLGYISRAGALVITDVITSPRGRESPAAPGRS
jgi:hypothetical protein